MRLILAESSTDLLLARRLRYRAYRDIGAIPQNQDQCFSDKYDDKNSSFTFNLMDGDVAVASIRACVQHDPINTDTAPALSVYPDELARVLHPKFCLVESNRFVIEPGNSSVAQAAVFLGIAAVASTNSCTDVCTAVRPNQVSFYERFLGMAAISEAKRYFGIDAEMILLWGNRESIKTSRLEQLRRKIEFDEERYADRLIIRTPVGQLR